MSCMSKLLDSKAGKNQRALDFEEYTKKKPAFIVWSIQRQLGYNSLGD